MAVSSRLGSRIRKLSAHILNHKRKAENVNWEWQEDISVQSPPQ